MSTVPSTPTSSSRNLEAKMLADGNALLQQRKDVLVREIRELTASKDAMILAIGHAPAQAEAEKRVHLDEIGRLEAQVLRRRDELKRVDNAIDEGNTALKAQKGAKETLEAQVRTLKTDVAEWEGKKASAETEARAAETKYSTLIKAKGDEIAALTTEAARIKSDNETAEQDGKRRLAEVVEQERVTTTRRDDLAIKEARLRKLYPNNPIIIS